MEKRNGTGVSGRWGGAGDGESPGPSRDRKDLHCLISVLDSNLSNPERGRSTTAPQSLTLLNAPEVVEAAKALAARLEKEPADQRVALAYRSILGRLPTEREAAVAREFLAKSPLRELCRALFNLNAFVYVE